jgi:hypothetical protein
VLRRAFGASAINGPTWSPFHRATTLGQVMEGDSMDQIKHIAAAVLAVLALGSGSVIAVGTTTEPAGASGQCPRDVAAASTVSTAPPTTTTRESVVASAPATPTTTAAAAPPTTAAAPVDAAPPRPLQENVTELDADATIDINSQPRDSLRQGGQLRLPVASLADNWNPNHPAAMRPTFPRCASRWGTSHG